MTLTLMGKKKGMTQIFDKEGNVVTCTVIHVEPNVITQIKSVETDGYTAVQLGFDKVKGKVQHTIDARTKKPQLGLFKKGNIEPRRFLCESRLDSTDGYEVGQEIGVDAFAEFEFLDAQGVSKGKGYQGVMKRHGFAGGPASHGSGFHRHAGSTGMRSSPGRGLPGGKKAGQMGRDNVTVQNLKVIMVNKDENFLVVKGQVPGPNNGLVYLAKAKKKHQKKK